MASRCWSAWRVMLAVGATLLAACCASCRWTKVIGGRVTDYDTGAPLAVPDGMVVYAAAAPGTKRQCYAGELGGAGSEGTLPIGTYASTTPANL